MTLLSRLPLQDVLPILPTPFTWTVLQGACEGAIRSFYSELGYAWPPGAMLLRLVKGHPYLNLVALAEAERALGAPVTPEALVSPARPARPAETVRRVLRLSEGAITRAPDVFGELQRWCARVHALSGRWMQADILQVMEEVERRATGLWSLYWELREGACAVRSDLAGQLPEKNGGQVETQVAELLVGLGDGRRCEEGLWELARVMQGASDPLSSAAGEALARFLAGCGHHGEDELEAGAPRWREDPASLLRRVRGLAPPPSPEGLKARREAAERALLSWAGLLRRRSLRSAIRRAQRLAELAPQGYDALVQLVDATRAWALAAGADATREGRLAQPSDIFWLEIEEVKQLMTGEWHDRERIRALVAERQAEHQAWKRRAAPDTIGL
ncbi:MAG: hypothetical protein IT330_08180 [Anaerolineae bacterium]|nr:hypothetical protein [Anaerolineae bacterium]